jgi:hypothetical protein
LIWTLGIQFSFLDILGTVFQEVIAMFMVKPSCGRYLSYRETTESLARKSKASSTSFSASDMSFKKKSDQHLVAVRALLHRGQWEASRGMHHILPSAGVAPPKHEAFSTLFPLSILKHGGDLLQAQPLSFWHKRIDRSQCHHACSTKQYRPY